MDAVVQRYKKTSRNYLNIVDIKAGDEPWNDAEECKDVVGELT